jgi:hypothetical protein
VVELKVTRIEIGNKIDRISFPTDDPKCALQRGRFDCWMVLVLVGAAASSFVNF